MLAQTKEKEVPLVFMNEHTYKGTVSSNKHVEETLQAFDLELPKNDEAFISESDLYQTLLYVNDQEEKDYQRYTDFRFVRWHPNCVDVLPQGGSKAAGIQKFIERAGFELKDVYAFGDGLNDIEMLQTVGTGVAMGNAEEELLKYADLVTARVDEDGIYKGLVTLGLI